MDLSARTTAKSSLRPSMWEARSRTGDAHAPKAEVNAVMDIIENLLHGVYVLPDMAESLRKLTPPLPAGNPHREFTSVVCGHHVRCSLGFGSPQEADFASPSATWVGLNPCSQPEEHSSVLSRVPKTTVSHSVQSQRPLPRNRT